MTAVHTSALQRWWVDRWFWLLLAAGPMVWIGLVLAGMPVQKSLPEWRVLLVIGVLSPILEEIVFRGGLQTYLLARAPFSHRFAFGISFANVLVSLVFSSFHLINQAPVWAAAVFVPSLVFGWAMDAYRSLLPCIALHMLYNLGFVLLFVA